MYAYRPLITCLVVLVLWGLLSCDPAPPAPTALGDWLVRAYRHWLTP